IGITSRSWQGGCLAETETRNNAVITRTDNTPTASRLATGQRLQPGDALVSATTTLTQRTDGNLVVTSKAGKVLWSTATGGNAGATTLLRADGNLVVRDVTDTTTLWQSGTSATGGSTVLQEHGNLVVYDTQGQSQWSTGTAVRNDVDGDGRGDMVNWYDYPDGHDALFRFPGTDSGALAAPQSAWTTAPGNWYLDQVKKVAGDFNGDGLSDVAVLYGYGDGTVRLWTFPGNSDGSFTPAFESWSTTPGNWEFARVRLHGGDFDGDGRDDLAAWYDYPDGSDALFTFRSDARGGFAAPVQGWRSVPGNWFTEQSKYVTGDFNGDGRDDLGVLYTYGGTAVKFWTFLANRDGGFDGAKLAWDNPVWGEMNRTDVHAGDFDGDGRDDVALWFDYADGHDSVYVLKGNKDGTVTGSPNPALNSPAGWLMRDQMKTVVADYNGDGRDDLATMYGYTDGTVRMFTWPAQADGTFGPGQTGWSTATGWEFGRVHVVNRHHLN
ncbi:FG-GAP-like repeat-containing protein, partial [Streptomyces sp. NPDC001941]|uniref:FG-GAP-like repeat-containing protein n=1 Tax=Streptomyces sp. NPDC001941 TaxID=3154659 RepID=UPI003326D559